MAKASMSLNKGMDVVFLKKSLADKSYDGGQGEEKT